MDHSNLYLVCIFLPVLLGAQVRISASEKLCGGKLDLESYHFLNKMCEDCFHIYRDLDIYIACR